MGLPGYLAMVFAAHFPRNMAEMARLTRECAADPDVSAADLDEEVRKLAQTRVRCVTSRMFAEWLEAVEAQRAALVVGDRV